MDTITPGMHQDKNLRQIVGWLFVTLIVFGSLLLANYLRPELINKEQLSALGYTVLEEKRPVGSLPSLLDHNGDPLSPSFFLGEWSLVFFGFTYCPDVCPTTLAVLGKVAQSLGEESPRIILVTVDPDRDKPTVLKKYVQAFNTNIMGITGDQSAIQELAMAFQVVFAKSSDTKDYMVDHSTHVALVSPNAEFIGFFRIPHRESTITQALQQLM